MEILTIGQSVGRVKPDHCEKPIIPRRHLITAMFAECVWCFRSALINIHAKMEHYKSKNIYRASVFAMILLLSAGLMYYAQAVYGLETAANAEVPAVTFPTPKPRKTMPSKTPMKDQNKSEKLHPLAADVWGGTGIIMT